MSVTDSPKQFLALIRDFATEKAHGERRVSDLRKRSLELRTELEAANADLDTAKSLKRSIELELRCLEAESFRKDASIQAQMSRISLLQEELSQLESELDSLKAEENASRDEFIGVMLEFSQKLRELQEKSVYFLKTNGDIEHLSDVEGEQMIESEQAPCKILGNFEDVEHKLARACAQMHAMEQESHEETIEAEKEYSELAQSMQRKYSCPNCHKDNMTDATGNFSSQEV